MSKQATRLSAIFFLLCVGGVVWFSMQNVTSTTETKSTTALPEFRAETLEGNVVNLRTFTKKPLVINFWSSWCAPCVAEMPVFADVQAHRQDVIFVFANQGDTREEVQAFLQKQRLSLDHVWLDEDLQLGMLLDSRVMPTTLVFNAKGERVGVHAGALSKAELVQLLEPLN